MILYLFLSTITSISTADSQNIGLLLEDTIDDHGWNRQGYEGLLSVHNQFNVDVFYKEEIKTKAEIHQAVKQLVDEHVSLIFGHGKSFSEVFSELPNDYPQVHFVVINGDVTGERVSSYAFDGYAMGYFAGVLSAIMSKNEQVGIIAAFPWQPEVNGFIAGVASQNEQIDVSVEYVMSWHDLETAKEFYEAMKKESVDILYPIGDGFHVELIELSKRDGLYVIGYVSDQTDLGESSVLSSTVQHVDQVYVDVVDAFLKGKLVSGRFSLDFQDGVISMGDYSSQVPEEVVLFIEEMVQYYIQTGEFKQVSYLP
ncbi:transcriptional regulator [Alkalihalobacillus pseudalcaliphilus]|nr:transcriptional regulator [Alkalihalobacillus pseudalcaliphilus]